MFWDNNRGQEENLLKDISCPVNYENRNEQFCY